MPLIALDILESKLSELLLVVAHLKSENASLKNQFTTLEEKLSTRKTSTSEQEVPVDIMVELDSLKTTLGKYKTERKDLYLRVSSIVKRLDDVIAFKPAKTLPKKGDI
ncbi:MAG: hypothetical protein WCJ46_06010 [bacterium]